MPLSPFVRAATLNWLFRGSTAYTPTSDQIIKLHTDDPGIDGEDNEVDDTGYEESDYNGGWEVPATADNPARTQIENTVLLNFGEADGTFTATHATIWDKDTPNNLLYYGALSAPVPFGSGNAIEFPAGNLRIGLLGAIPVGDGDGDGDGDG